MSRPAAQEKYLDQAGFHRLWTALPPSRCDRSFWNGVAALCDPFLDERCALRSAEYFTVQQTGRIQQDEVHYLDETVSKQCNDQRMHYDAFTLWNPHGLAAQLKIPLGVVVEQLLLGVEFGILAIRFVLSCRSCAFDLKHFTSVRDVPFKESYHSSNSLPCPMCTDRTAANSLESVNVFFQLCKLHPIFHRQHHRSFVTEQAQKQRLESCFCPSGAAFAVPLLLPRGKYLVAAPFLATMVELDVLVGAAAFGDRDPFLPRIIDVKKYCIEPTSTAPPNAPHSGARRKSGAAHMAASVTLNGSHVLPPSHTPRIRPLNGAGPASPHAGRNMNHRPSLFATASNRRVSRAGPRNSSVGFALGQTTASAVSEGVEEGPYELGQGMAEIAPVQVLELKHGKVQLRVYNSTPYSGFLDIYVKFDRRAEFSAVEYPKQFTLPDLMHCMPRGLRSPYLPICTPLAPSETLTKSIYVRHYFDLDTASFLDAQVLAVLREVHRYSLEDQHGLLLNVSNGGTCFESSFMSVTAALAASICFFQRVLVRLDENVAMALRTSITEGPLHLASYQGQYNDLDNTRSAYADVQFVGPSIFASNHPAVVAPTLYAYMVEAPTVPEEKKRDSGGRVSEFMAELREEEFALRGKHVGGRPAAAEGATFVPWLSDSEITPRRSSKLGATLGTASFDKSNHGHSPPAFVGYGSDQGAGGRGRSISVPLDRYLSEFGAGSPRADGGGLHGGQERQTMVRFELRSVCRSGPGNEVTLADAHAGSVPLRETYACRNSDGGRSHSHGDTPAFSPGLEASVSWGTFACGLTGSNTKGHASPSGGEASSPPHRNGNDSRGSECDSELSPADKVEDDDVVLPYFIRYLKEQLAGTRVVAEPHALVVAVPLSVMHAAVQLSNMVDRTAYVKEYLGPF